MRNAAAYVLAAAFLLAGCQDEGAGSAGNVSNGAPAEAPPATSAPASTKEAAETRGDAAAPAPAEPSAKAAPAAGASAWSKSGYRLVGTEPFWGGTVTGTKILYQTPEDQAGAAVAATASYGPAGELYSGSLGGKPFILTLTKGPCSDGMSDKVHAYTAALQVGGEARQGCADPQ